jgi:hypothetical protein
MMSWNTGWNGGGWVAMSLMMLFWAALIGLAIWAAVRLLAPAPRRLRPPPHGPRSTRGWLPVPSTRRSTRACAG